MPNPVVLEMPASTVRRRAWAGILLGLGVLGLLAVVGYGAFLLFVIGGPTLAGGSLLAVAVIAGAGAFFSPCSFPVLPSYFAYAQVVRREDPASPRAFQTLLHGAAAAAGVVAFNGILGLVLAVAGLGIAQSFVLLSPSPSGVTLALRVLVGTSLLAFGLAQMANLSIHGALLDRFLRLLRPRGQQGEPLAALFLYGFGYTLVGIGCTAPFLATVIVISLASGGFVPALAGFLAFALTMAGLMVFVSLFATSSRRHLLRGLSARTPTIKRAAGAALVAFGSLLLAVSVWPAVLRPLFP